MSFIHEGDVYRLITHSKLPKAEEFEKWVFDEVLPSLRKTGTYSIKENKAKKPNLSSVNMMAKILKDRYKEAGVDPKFTVVAINNLYKEQTGISLPLPIKVEEEKLYDCTEIAKELKVYYKTGKPHNRAVSAIIQKLNIDDSLIITTPFTKNGHSDFTTQYKPTVLKQIKYWLKENNYPSVINYKDKNGVESTCHIVYRLDEKVAM